MLPVPPSFDEVLEAWFGGMITWLLGTGAIASLVIWVFGTYLAISSYWAAAADAKRRLPAGLEVAREARRRVREGIRNLKPPAMLAAALMTVLVCAAQGAWLWGARWMGGMLGELWNLPAWGSWEIHNGTYYRVFCIVLLALAWVFALVWDDQEVFSVGAFIAVAAPLLMFAVSVLFAAIAIAIGALAELLGGGADDAWRLARMYGRYVALFLSYAALSAAAIGGLAVVSKRWRAAVTGPGR